VDAVDSPTDRPPDRSSDRPPGMPAREPADMPPPGASGVELLVCVDPGAAARTLEALGRIAAVTQRLPPRLVLMAVDDAEGRAGVLGTPGVVGAFAPGQHPDLPGLTESERMFVDGWELRQRPKHRPGDGASWNSGGYDPPDAPPPSPPPAPGRSGPPD
jgi:hypothetical protein